MSIEVKYIGVTFENVRKALCATYFLYKDMPEEEWEESLRYVVPMQHNFENPIEPGGQDTWIQFWIDEDDRMTQDYNTGNQNQTVKLAKVTARFLGTRAEIWSKAFHHLIKRRSVAAYFLDYCNAVMLDYVSPIVPMNVDYFGANTTIAHDLSFELQYDENMKFSWKPLGYISIPDGEISGSILTGGIM